MGGVQVCPNVEVVVVVVAGSDHVYPSGGEVVVVVAVLCYNHNKSLVAVVDDVEEVEEVFFPAPTSLWIPVLEMVLKFLDRNKYCFDPNSVVQYCVYWRFVSSYYC